MFLDTLYDYPGFVGGPPIATPGPGGGGPDIAIIGAGPAGLVAAYELLRAGFNPVVFEATDAIGGRCRTLDMGGGALAELGAMRVPANHGTFWHYANTLGLKRMPFPDPGTVETCLYYKNQALTWASSAKPPAPFDKIASDFSFLAGIYASAIYPAWQTGNLDAVAAIWQRMIDKCGIDSLYSAVFRTMVWGDAEMEAFGALGLGTGGFGPMFQIDFITALRYVLEQHGQDQRQINEGMSAFINGLAGREVTVNGKVRKVADILQTGKPVVSISRQGSDPVLQFVNGEVVCYRAVIVATSTRSAEMMGLTLPSSAGESLVGEGPANALRSLHMAAASKLFIRTATKFWKSDPTLPLCILTDELPRAVYCLDYPNTENGVVLVSYTWEDDSAKMLALTPEECLDRCLSVIRRANPEFAKYLVPVDGQIVKIDWLNERWQNGGFQLPQPGQEAMLRDAFYQFQTARDPKADTGVYLAGDGISWLGGWIEGALQTGINAACAAAARLGGEVRTCSPLDLDAHRFRYQSR